MPEIRTYINTGDNEIEFLFEVAEQGKRHTVAGGAVAGEGL